jgi:hypothetical protein
MVPESLREKLRELQIALAVAEGACVRDGMKNPPHPGAMLRDVHEKIWKAQRLAKECVMMADGA